MVIFTSWGKKHSFAEARWKGSACTEQARHWAAHLPSQMQKTQKLFVAALKATTQANDAPSGGALPQKNCTTPQMHHCNRNNFLQNRFRDKFLHACALAHNCARCLKRVTPSQAKYKIFFFLRPCIGHLFFLRTVQDKALKPLTWPYWPSLKC